MNGTGARATKGTLRSLLAAVLALLCIAPSASADLTSLIAQGKVRQYTRFALMDQALGIEAVRTIIPAGWQGGGDVSWPMQSIGSPAFYTLQAASPDRTVAMFFISEMNYEEPLYVTFVGPSNVPELTRHIPGDQLYREGNYTEHGNPMLRLMTPEEYSAYVLRSLDPSIEAVSVVSAERDPEARKALAQMASTREAQLNQTFSATPGAFVRDTTIDLAVLELTLTRQRGNLRAIAVTMIDSGTSGTDSSAFKTASILWSAKFTALYVAAPDAFEANRDVFSVFLQNTITNAQWSRALSQTGKEMGQVLVDIATRGAQQNIRNVQERAKAWSQRINERYESSLSQDSNHRILEGWTDVLLYRDNWEGPDGGVLKVDHDYDRVYEKDGDIYATRGVELDPQEYKALKKLPGVLPPGK
jgi:hypothetical protein